MNLKAKIYVENQKKTAEEKLATRLAVLNEKGLDKAAVQRDAVFKKIRADIRKANYRLAAIAAQQKLNAERAKAKADKLAAPKVAQEKSKPTAKKTADKAEKKSKKEKTKKTK
jgi:hypothetical protein